VSKRRTRSIHQAAVRLDPADEAAVRQFVANDDFEAALDRAKELHKEHRSRASEALLVEAYAGRIRALLRRKLTVEAQSLIDLVREKYPSARARLQELLERGALAGPPLDELACALDDPALEPDRRAAIERTLQREISDLTVLAGSDRLPHDHPLRIAASALQRAFVAVTTGPVDRDVVALPEVSRRSPLAPWKLLVRGIASFYENDDESCERHLSGIPPESAPARLVPAIEAAIGKKPTLRPTPGASALQARVVDGPTGLHAALETLEQAFAETGGNRLVKAIRTAMQECRRRAPELAEALAERIAARGALAGLALERIASAIGPPMCRNARFLQVVACALEQAADAGSTVAACHAWEEFRDAAAREGWFASSGPEAAVIALHMADLLRRVPDDLLRSLQSSARTAPAGPRLSYLFPEELYHRACALDPHPEAFSQWMDWAIHSAPWQVERVAAEWHRIHPRDIEPIERLMEASEARGAIGSALGWLTKLERLDALYPDARRIRRRLLVRLALTHIQQKKPGLAADDLSALGALDGVREGDWRAVVAAVQCLASEASRDRAGADRHRLEVERILESRAAASLLIAVMGAGKQRKLAGLPPVATLGQPEVAALPIAAARVGVLADDLRLTVPLPAAWVGQVAHAFAATRHALDTRQLRALGAIALAARSTDLAYAISAAGLDLAAGPGAAFLLLRARALAGHHVRSLVCAGAAAELARQAHDAPLLQEAVDFARELGGPDAISLSAEQLQDVLRREKAEPVPPGRGRQGPDYGRLLTRCTCPACRGAAPEDAAWPVDELDSEDDPGDLPEMPEELLEVLFEEARRAIHRGETFDAFVDRVLNDRPPPRRPKRRRKS
jgi:hypothetical protein